MRMLVAASVVMTAVLGSTVPGRAEVPTPAAAIPRSEPPRPDRFRADWQTLNGPWSFTFDDGDRGVAERWYAKDKPFAQTIVVPYAFQTKLSGIADTSFHDVVWYRRSLRVPEAWRARRLLIHFGAVDYEATVWVNGVQVGFHRGGHTPFAVDATDALKADDNALVVRAFDPSIDRTLPRGKQYWEPKSAAIWYTRTSGIWQPVWMEGVNATHLTGLRITPDVDRSRAEVEVVASRPEAELRLRVTGRRDNAPVAAAEATCQGTRCALTLGLPDQKLWSPEHPNLYDLTLELVSSGQVLDRVESYFGQRKIAVQGDLVFLNNAPYFERLVLDQGYWPESTITPPSDDAIQQDIKLTKALGFNGARKHQKVEDPRWLYWADRMGLLVWGEMANAYEFTEEYVSRFVGEWQEAVARDYSHPCIVAWVPINESWGVPQITTSARQQAHLRSLYQLTHSLDATRPVVDNDGWEHVDTTDLFTLHDYARTGEDMAAKYEVLKTDRSHIPRNGREALAFGYKYNGAPLLMTEFGGIAFRLQAAGAANEWGYSGVEPTREAFLKRLDGLLKALRANPAWAGYCYTQLTDVEQEINGLLTADRKPKADLDQLKRIFTGQ